MTGRGSVAVAFLDPGEWSACFGMSLVDLYLVDACGPRRIVPNGKQLRNLCLSGGIVDGRNQVAKQFLDTTDCEWLFFIDTDMGFPPDAVEALIAVADPVARPVVGGLCFKQHREGSGDFYSERYSVMPTLFSWVELEDRVGFAPILDYERDSLVEVAATGAACILIHRSALEAVRAKYGDGSWFDRITHPVGPTTFSEDLSFCVRIAGCDLPLFVHTGVKTSHHKGGLFLDEALYDHQRATTEAIAAASAEA